jgi:hypothetical protein
VEGTFIIYREVRLSVISPVTTHIAVIAQGSRLSRVRDLHNGGAAATPGRKATLIVHCSAWKKGKQDYNALIGRWPLECIQHQQNEMISRKRRAANEVGCIYPAVSHISSQYVRG